MQLCKRVCLSFKSYFFVVSFACTNKRNLGLKYCFLEEHIDIYRFIIFNDGKKSFNLEDFSLKEIDCNEKNCIHISRTEEMKMLCWLQKLLIYVTFILELYTICRCFCLLLFAFLQEMGLHVAITFQLRFAINAINKWRRFGKEVSINVDFLFCKEIV